MNIKEQAQKHVLTVTKNISELNEIPVQLEVKNRKGVNEAGKEYEYDYITVMNQDYRMPGSVLGQLKVIIEDSPDLQSFKVMKTGEGMNTRYTVIPRVTK